MRISAHESPSIYLVLFTVLIPGRWCSPKKAPSLGQLPGLVQSSFNYPAGPPRILRGGSRRNRTDKVSLIEFKAGSIVYCSYLGDTNIRRAVSERVCQVYTHSIGAGVSPRYLHLACRRNHLHSHPARLPVSHLN